MKRLVAVLALAATPLAASAYDWLSLGVEATLAAPQLGVDRMPGSQEPLGATGDLGGSILLRVGPLAVGLAADGNLGREAGRMSTRSGIGGLALDLLPFVRLELLGELGTANLSGDGLRATSFYGARPGLSFKAPAVPLRVGVWGLARWNLPGMPAGEPSYGILARAGFEL